jgi:hypothetical protein
VTRALESIGRTIAYAQDIAQVSLDRCDPRAGNDKLRVERRAVVATPVSL